MWICLNDGFVSVVQDQNRPDRMLVRARRRAILEAMFPDQEIIVTQGSDYLYRVFVPRSALSEAILQRLGAIDYENFKASVPDRELHNLYFQFWSLHARYQR